MTSTSEPPPQATPPSPSPSPSGPTLRDFLTSDETRLRDMVAFAMAAEAGGTLPRDGITALRNRAESELQAYAYRVFHNRVEIIRYEAMQEQSTRMTGGLSFSRVVAANLVALTIGCVLALAATAGEPSLLSRLRPLFDSAAQLFARLFAGS